MEQLKVGNISTLIQRAFNVGCQPHASQLREGRVRVYGVPGTGTDERCHQIFRGEYRLERRGGLSLFDIHTRSRRQFGERVFRYR